MSVPGPVYEGKQIAIQRVSLETGMEERKECEGSLPECQPGLAAYSCWYREVLRAVVHSDWRFARRKE